MFPTTTTKPRPVPSKGALRVLYQLAYISSGTAVGVGVLCAEERRRRTQIVQRIVENGRRVRGSEKYRGYGSAALAVREQGQEYEELSGGGYGVEGTMRAGGLGGSREGHMKEAMKGRDLPSVVGKEYEMVYPETRKKRRTIENGRRVDSRVEMWKATSKTQSRGAGEDATNGKDTEPAKDSRRLRERGFKVQTRQDGGKERMLGRAKPCRSKHQTHDGSRSRELEAWREECYGLLDVGDLSEAIDTFCRCPADTDAPDLADKLADKLFHATLERKWLGKCAKLLRHEPRGPSGYSKRCEALIQACDPDEEGLLLALVFEQSQMFHRLPLTGRLNKSTREILASACLADPSRGHEFEQLYNSLDPKGRSNVDTKQSNKLLRSAWRRTKNIDAVLAQLHSMTEQMQEAGIKDAMQSFNETMAEIFISANRPDEALDIISRIARAENTNGKCIGLAACAFADRGAWDSVDRILWHAASRDSFHVSQRYRKYFKRLVLVYSEHHSATQVWKFVTRLMDKLHYTPDRALTHAILQVFVSKDAVVLVPKWLRMLEISGVSFFFNAESALDLIRAYYEKHRPSHVLVMWLCRRLAHWIPDLDPRSFVELIEKSISNDLAGGDEDRNKVWQRDFALQRLDRVRTTTSEVPSPGYKHDGRLYFKHPDATSESLQRIPPASNGDRPGSDTMPTASESAIENEMDGGTAQSDRRERDMAVLLSLRKYDQVLQKYEDDLDASGAPKTPEALTLAVRASLRSYESSEHAEQMIRRAENADMNVTEALSCLGIHRIQRLDHEQANADKLRVTVIRFYELAREKSHAAGPHLGVTAAHSLIKNGHPRAGLRLLKRVEHFLETEGRDPHSNIVSATVKLRGYSVIASFGHVIESVRDVLRRNLRISPGFLQELKQAHKKMLGLTRRQRAMVAMHVELCRRRRKEQQHQGQVVGNKLVRVIAGILREETTVSLESRKEMDQELFGRTSMEEAYAEEAEGQYGRGYDGPFSVKSDADWHDALQSKPTAPNRDGDAAEDHDKTSTDSVGDGSLNPDDSAIPEPEPASRPQASRQTRRSRLARAVRAKSQDISRDIRWDPKFDPHARQASRVHLDVRWMRQYRTFLRKPMVDAEGRMASFRWFMPSESRAWKMRERRRRSRLGRTWVEGDEGVWHRSSSDRDAMSGDGVGVGDEREDLSPPPQKRRFVPFSAA